MPDAPPPGWYQDPDGKHVNRYWDGRTWTPWTSAGHLTGPAGAGALPYPGGVINRPPLNGQRRTKNLSWVIPIVVVLGLGALLAGQGHSSSQTSTTASTTTAFNSTAAVTGTEDDWTASVCRTGTYADGLNGLPDASDNAVCSAKTARGSIRISKFNSQLWMRNALAVAGGPYYVSGIEPDGTIIVFYVGLEIPPSALNPLTTFGFTIQKAHGS